MPGRFTEECVGNGRVVDFITRVAVWKSSGGSCRSGYFRHAVCVFGIEDFSWLAGSPNLMANKMMPDFDYAVVDCMHELLHNRTHFLQNDHPLNISYYANQPNVLYHKNWLKPDPNYRLNCTLDE
ncbi:hypothetical protein OESDEN_05281 [Oesophagostomum dentatum]|uniref:Uncharacterized protein n=1 Tax=Oesophagostomum dentatum TaxID=61180 RepID=A0A0B1TG33_OESDE|nr:hypothetical protein OESDEN_05281 [Oesophagostomum dentatum]